MQVRERELVAGEVALAAENLFERATTDTSLGSDCANSCSSGWMFSAGATIRAANTPHTIGR